MEKHEAIAGFLAERVVAVAGVSRNAQKLGSSVFQELKSRGYTVYPVNPNAEKIGEDVCFPDLKSLPKGVGGAIIVVRPSETEKLVRDAFESGINKVWIQRGAGSEAAVRFCEEHGMICVNSECILMFAQPVGSIHSVHRFFSKLFRPGLFGRLSA